MQANPDFMDRSVLGSDRVYGSEFTLEVRA